MMRALKSFVAIFEWALGRETDALVHIEELIREMPDRADLHQQRVLILIDMGRFDEARHEMRQALALKPQHPEYHETFGIVERMAGNPGAALQPLTFSATARSGDPRARAELVACQAQLGLVGDARAALETLPGYALHDPFVAYARATLAVTDGSDDQAVAFLAEAQAQRPHLGLRAGVDPMFRVLLSDPGRRAALAEAGTNAATVAAGAASRPSGTPPEKAIP
jgi:Flp pilus assembly protein TadD